MTSQPEEDTEQWIIIPTSSVAASSTMATSNPETKESQTEVQSEVQNPTIEAQMATSEKPTEKKTEKPDTTEKKDNNTTTGSAPPLNRADTADSWLIASDVEEYVPRSRTRRRAAPIPAQQRNNNYSPFRGQNFVQDVQPPVIMLSSSTKLLSSVNNYDGVADLTFPARGSVYLTTFPFSGKDVRKWSWLFGLVAASGGATEGEWFPEPEKRGPSNAGPSPYFEHEDIDWNGEIIEERYPDRRQARRVRDRSPYYDPINVDIPKLLLSRVLDIAVIPDEGDEKNDVRFWIVVRNRTRIGNVKLLLAESRKAAGILCFYEALNGNSVLFVGAVVSRGKLLKKEKGEKLKIKKAESLEEARKMREEGVIGVFC